MIRCYNKDNPTPIWANFCDYCWVHHWSRIETLEQQFYGTYEIHFGVEYLTFINPEHETFFRLRWS